MHQRDMCIETNISTGSGLVNVTFSDSTGYFGNTTTNYNTSTNLVIKAEPYTQIHFIIDGTSTSISASFEINASENYTGSYAIKDGVAVSGIINGSFTRDTNSGIGRWGFHGSVDTETYPITNFTIERNNASQTFAFGPYKHRS